MLPVPTRIVQLTVDASGDPSRIPLNVRIFHADTFYWIRARVMPGTSLKGLLSHLIDEIERRKVARLPVNLFHYNIFDMSREITLLPELWVDEIGGTVLYVHESEFINAFDRKRRVELIAGMAKQLEKRLTPPEQPLKPAETVREARGETEETGSPWAAWHQMVR